LTAAHNNQQFSEEELQMVESYAMDVAKIHAAFVKDKNHRVSCINWGYRMRHVLYVDGLSKAITADQLKELFAIYGQVPWVRVARHRGKSASYGFVELTSGVQALRALVDLDGTILDGSSLQVYLTPPQSGKNGRGARSLKRPNEKTGRLNRHETGDDSAAVIAAIASMANTEGGHL
jgi:RNA recognition motif-containing protein